jgi:hypothetical protein
MVNEKEAAASAGFGVAGMEGWAAARRRNRQRLRQCRHSGPKVKAARRRRSTSPAVWRPGHAASQGEAVYPPIAKAARVSGTVVLQATISKTGTIENLRVISGTWASGTTWDGRRVHRHHPLHHVDLVAGRDDRPLPVLLGSPQAVA